MPYVARELMPSTHTGYSFLKDMTVREAMAEYMKQKQFIQYRTYTPDDEDIYAADCMYLMAIAERIGEDYVRVAKHFIAAGCPR